MNAILPQPAVYITAMFGLLAVLFATACQKHTRPAQWACSKRLSWNAFQAVARSWAVAQRSPHPNIANFQAHRLLLRCAPRRVSFSVRRAPKERSLHKT